MTQLLFGDDISQSAKQIEEAEKLRSKFSSKKHHPFWTFGSRQPGGVRPRGFFGKTPFRGSSLRYHPYGQRRGSPGGDSQHTTPRPASMSKNSRGRRHSNPRH
ncbi:hypothetical protein E2C01_046716 [Portunus trituberculatus]|uniref:Uncharacterized protein n=1 Tax=Portunus trituberculatus TaxID=210409 RepID=A0A5B7G5H1_PORTR|nr:hypothetical protein [Portunus trituberculatus]